MRSEQSQRDRGDGYLVASGGEGEGMRGVALLERGLHDPHGDVLHDRGRGGDRRRARASARQHERVPAHEALVHQILGLLPHVREQRRPSDPGLLLVRHCYSLPPSIT